MMLYEVCCSKQISKKFWLKTDVFKATWGALLEGERSGELEKNASSGDLKSKSHNIIIMIHSSNNVRYLINLMFVAEKLPGCGGLAWQSKVPQQFYYFSFQSSVSCLEIKNWLQERPQGRGLNIDVIKNKSILTN